METSTVPPYTFDDALDEVHTRFVLNLPASELETADRVFFQLEQAWWYYEDWICDPHPERELPRFENNLRGFCLKLFQYSPLLGTGDNEEDANKFKTLWNQFSKYRRKIANYGCILLSADCTQVILTTVWNGNAVTFPAGKINQNEDGATAAARETYEETGFDPSCTYGVTASWKKLSPEKITWAPVRKEDCLVYTEENGKRRNCYVVAGVPKDFPFAPVARKEVSEVAWYSLDEIPRPNYAVIPFMGPLRKWIRKYCKRNGLVTPNRSRPRGNRSRSNTPRVRESDDVVTAGLAVAGESSGWSAEEMFKTNEQLSGRRVEYDGNPHVFTEEGLAKGDPHAYRVVGGSFLNSQGATSAAAPNVNELQPLYREHNDGPKGLTPFFSTDGATPWGEVVEDLNDGPKLSTVHKKKKKKSPGKTHTKVRQVGGTTPSDGFLTDAQITKRSQSVKGVRNFEQEYERDMREIERWAANLPQSQPNGHFKGFTLDADAIMEKVWPILGVAKF